MPRLRIRYLAAFALGVAGCRSGQRDSMGDVSVHASAAGAALVDAIVLRHAADGAFLGRTETGVDGTTTVDAEESAAVTVVLLTWPRVRLQTIVGAEPGDDLFFDFPGQLAMHSVDAELRLAGSAFPGAQAYHLGIAECGLAYQSAIASSQGSVVLQVSGNCGPSLTPWATAVDSTGSPVAFQVLPSIEPESLTASGATLQGPWRTDWNDVAVSLVDPPLTSWPYAYFVATSEALDAAGRVLAADVFGSDYDMEATLRFLPFPSHASSRTRVSYSTRSAYSLPASYGWESVGPPAVEWTVHGDALPALPLNAQLAVATSSLFFSWIEGTPSMDEVELRASWDVPDGYLEWTVRCAPDIEADVFLPTLPEDLSDYRPPAPGDIQAAVVFRESTETAGWDDARTWDPRIAPGTTFVRRSALIEPYAVP